MSHLGDVLISTVAATAFKVIADASTCVP